MNLIPVDNKHTAQEFLEVARILYKNDPNYVCPLDHIIESIFDRQKNKYYNQGDAIRWILKDDKGNLTGRVAAFYNTLKAKRYDPPAGGMGFFECINDRDAAFTLFDACAGWHQDRGMGAMDGPVNFGENDNFWGLLVEGFTPPAFGMNYHPPYYKDLFEAYGFKPFFVQETKHLDLSKPFPERFWKIAEWVMQKPVYTFEHFRKSKIQKYAADIVTVYNQAWIFHEHFTHLDIEKVKKGFDDISLFVVEDFIWFAYHEGKPIAFLIMLPDVNQILKKFNGKLNFHNKIKFWFLKNRKIINRSRITIMGVVPEFQGRGVESALFWHLQKPLLKKRPHYKEIEISWVGDFNPKMQAVIDAMNASTAKKHITYRKIFKPKTTFHNAVQIPVLKKESTI